MKLFDMHTHTKGISRCSRLSPAQLCAALRNDGTDGFVLTNHFSPYHVTGDFHEWVKKYEKEYFATKEAAKDFGLSVLFGIEVTLENRDFLLYGVTTSCLFDSERPLFEFTLPELYEFAHAHGALLIHAHPFRSGGQPADAAYLDGVEINCHPLYLDNRKADVYAYAKKHGLLVTCGSDYHGDIYKAHCGVYLPADLQTEEELAEFLKKGQPELLVHDIDKDRARATVIH